MTNPRIYVTSLSDYNDGKLYGEWIDIYSGMDESDILKAINEMLAKSKTPGAEEWAIHDYEGFEGIRLSENPDLSEVCTIANGLEEHGPAFAKYVDLMCIENIDDNVIESFQEAYQGEFDSEEAWAEDFMESTGGLDSIPENLRYYFDFEKYARDCELGGDINFVHDGGTVYVFLNN